MRIIWVIPQRSENTEIRIYTEKSHTWLMNYQYFPDWSGLEHMIWGNPDSLASIWYLKTKVSRANVQCYLSVAHCVSECACI